MKSKQETQHFVIQIQEMKVNFGKAIELKRVLEDVCERLEAGHTSGSILDINGNKVGEWSR